MTKVVAITIKGLGQDENGLQQYVWATQKQADMLMDAQYDDDKKDKLFRLGDKYFKLKDIIGMKTVDLDTARQWPSMQYYLLEQVEKEKRLEAGQSAERPKELSDKINGLVDRCSL